MWNIVVSSEEDVVNFSTIRSSQIENNQPVIIVITWTKTERVFAESVRISAHIDGVDMVS